MASRVLGSARELGEVVSGTKKFVIEPRLRRSWYRAPVVVPADQRRQGHQNRLGATARLQAEQCAAVVNEIEFHVSAAPIELKISLALAPWLVHAAFHAGHVSRKDVLAAPSGCLVARGEKKKAVAPVFIFLI